MLAEQDGTAVGFALVYYAGWTPAFSCVLPHRYACLGIRSWTQVCGQGIGSQLLAAASAGPATGGWNIWSCRCWPRTRGAQHLYESQDFVEATKVMRCML